MKIINLIQKPQLRGAEIFACQLSEHLMQKGHEVLVVCIFPGEASLPFTGQIIKLDRNLKHRFWDIDGWKRFDKIVREFKPDIIQANAADTLKFAVSSKLFFRWQNKIVFRNANKMGDFIDSKWKLKLNSFYLSKVNYVISVSEECENDFRKTFNPPKKSIKTIQIGIEEKSIGEPPKDLKVLFENHKVITHIGGFVPEKNHFGLLEIVEKLVQKYPDLKLLMLGEGKLKKDIQAMGETKGLGKNLMFLGYRNDVLEILKASNAFVLPSLIEGLPGVILEAMYCGTPVIANNVGGIKEVVVNEKTGYLIEKGDIKKFSRHILEVLEKPDKSLELTSNAKKLVIGEFTNEKISQRFLDAYGEVLSK